MTIAKYIGMDVHKESISIAVMNSTGKFGMECVIGTKPSSARQITCEPSSSMMSSSAKALSKQLLGVRAVLRSKNALTPQTLLEMSV
jgi:hypothetical protein